VSSGFGLNVGVIAQEYKTITRLFLCKHALVEEDSGQNPHRAIKIDPTKFKSVLGRTWPWLLVAESLKSLSFILVLNSILSLLVIFDGQLP
jgi:hypothetical protein